MANTLGTPPTAEEREAAVWQSCPQCDALPGEPCERGFPSHKLPHDVHLGRIRWLRAERTFKDGTPAGTPHHD